MQSQTESVSNNPIPLNTLDNLIQGRLYFPNYFPIKGNPFLTKNWTLEDIQLLGKDYLDLPIWYDIYLDELILLHQLGANHRFIRLNKDHVQGFSLENRRFVNLDFSEYRNTGLGKGYYEVAFEDQVSLLVKRALEVLDEEGSLVPYFSRKDRWFLIKEGQAFRINNKKSFFAAVDKTDQAQLSLFIKKQKIRFKHAGDQEWLQLVQYLNTLRTD